MTEDGGFVGRYCLGSGWTSSYPETTGYLIPTILRLSDRSRGGDLQERCRRAVEFLLSLQLPGGAFPGGEVDDNRASPSVFNTAQVLCGLLAWSEADRNGDVEGAMEGAVAYLLGVQEAEGPWVRDTFGATASAYYSHAACWLARYGVLREHEEALEGARRHLEWVLSLIDPESGWIERSGFPDHHAAGEAMTHNLGYTLWGLLRCGDLLESEAAVAAVERAARRTGELMERTGYLPGVVGRRWESRARYVCLTGNCQIAQVWIELARRTSDPVFLTWADDALDAPRAVQSLTAKTGGIRGGLPGSAPIWGDYLPNALPNWAVKFFLDALLDLEEARA